MAWNRLSTLGWASSPANAGTTRMSTARPRSMNPARFSSTLPVPGSGSSRGASDITVPTCASRACASRSSLSSK